MNGNAATPATAAALKALLAPAAWRARVRGARVCVAAVAVALAAVLALSCLYLPSVALAAGASADTEIGVVFVEEPSHPDSPSDPDDPVDPEEQGGEHPADASAAPTRIGAEGELGGLRPLIAGTGDPFYAGKLALAALAVLGAVGILVAGRLPARAAAPSKGGESARPRKAVGALLAAICALVACVWLVAQAASTTPAAYADNAPVEQLTKTVPVDVAPTTPTADADDAPVEQLTKTVPVDETPAAPQLTANVPAEGAATVDSASSEESAAAAQDDAAAAQPAAAAAVEPRSVTNTYYCGTAKCEEDTVAGTLVISPGPDGNTLARTEVSYDQWMKRWPWLEHDYLQSVVVKPGVNAGPTMSEMFRGMTWLKSIDISGLNTSSTTNMSSLFQGCSGLTSIDLRPLDTSSVIDMNSLFQGCSGLTSIDLSSLNTSSATNMHSLFMGCSGLTSINLGSIDTSKNTNFTYFFHGCRNLSSIDISMIDTSSATSIGAMFGLCQSLKSVNVSHFDTSKVRNFNEVFAGCSSLTSIDVSNFKTPNAQSMGSMFGYCSNLTEIDLSSFTVSNVTSMGTVFAGCSKLSKLTLPADFDVSKVTTMRQMFYSCTSLAEIPANFMFGPNMTATDSKSECFKIGGSTPFVTTYRGTDASVIGYDWPADNRALKGTALSLAQPLSVTGDVSQVGSTLEVAAPVFADACRNAQASYQWYRAAKADGSGAQAIAGATKAAYAVTVDDCSSYLLCRVTDGLGAYEGTFSTQALGPVEPRMTGAVSVTGRAYAGQTLTAEMTGLPAGATPVYQWYRADSASGMRTSIGGATGSAYVPADPADVGKYLFCEVTASGFYGALSSQAVGPVGIAWGTVGPVAGGCAWAIDAKGALSVDSAAPAPGSGSLGDVTASPWAAYATRVTSAAVGANVQAGASLRSLFSGCSNLATADLSRLAVPLACDVSHLFLNCTSLSQAKLPASLPCSDVRELFRGCTNLATVDVTGLDTSTATSLSSMFRGCSALEEVAGSAGLRADAAGDLSHMFEGCAQLASIDLSGLAAPKATTVEGLFQNCSSLTSATFSSGLVGEQCKSVASVFDGCQSLTVVPESFTFGTARSLDTSRCFAVGAPYGPSNLLDTTYLGKDWRVAWALSDLEGEGRQLVAWRLIGSVKLTPMYGAWRQGRPVTATAEFQEPTGAVTPAFQWMRVSGAEGGAEQAQAIPGATAATYTPGPEDVGKRLRCVVTAPSTGAQGELAAESPVPVAPAQVSVTVPNVTGIVVDERGQAQAPDASVYALGNPAGADGSSEAVALVGVSLERSEARYPGGTWSLGTHDAPTAYVNAGTFGEPAAPNAYPVTSAPAVPVGGTMPLQWAVDLKGAQPGPAFAALLADAAEVGGAAYGAVTFTVAYVPPA